MYSRINRSPTKVKVKVNNKTMNSLLDSGSQVSTGNKSYCNKHPSDIPLQPVDMPLEKEAAVGGTVYHYG